MKRFLCLLLTLSILLAVQTPLVAGAEETTAESMDILTENGEDAVLENEGENPINRDAPAVEAVGAEPVIENDADMEAVDEQPTIAASREATPSEPRQRIATPGEPVPQEATPDEPIPQDETSAEPVSQEIIPSEPLPREATPAEPVPQEIIPSEPVSQEATPAEPVSQEIIPSEPIPQEALSAETILVTAIPAAAAPEEEIPQSPLQLSAGSLRIDRSAYKKLALTYNGEAVSSDRVKWKSSNTSVATVSSGRVTGQKPGTAVITATYKGETAECAVTVIQGVTAVKLSPYSLEVDAGATVAPKVSVSPSNASDPTLVWASSNPAAATVNENGVITGVSGGTATVTATASNGKSAKIKVKVVEPVTGVVIPEAVTVEARRYVKLDFSVLPETASNKKLTWTTSNRKVATVSSGRVTGVAGGECVISAKSANGIVAQCAVTVVQPASSVTVSKSSVKLDAGKTIALSATVRPSSATDPTVSWRSANPDVATVNENGVVTAIAGGSTKIFAETANGKKASCAVTVTQPVEEIRLPAEITVGAHEYHKLSVTILPETATNQRLTWTSTDRHVATMSSTGKVNGIAGGECVLTATAESGATASVKVTVIQPVSSVRFKKTYQSVDVGATLALTAAVSPASATDPSLSWSSSNPAVATVDANGVVTGVSAGAARITAQAVNGKNHAVKVTVTPPVESIRLVESATVGVKKSITLKAVALPENAPNRKIQWSSSNPQIATVSAYGSVKGVSLGSCVITAKTANGTSAQCVVTVVQPVTSVKLNLSSAKLSLFGTLQLTAEVKPDNATDPTITWKSSREHVAVVDQNGVVTGVGGGDTIITALSSSGVKKTCRITVKEIKPTSMQAETHFITLSVGASASVLASFSPTNTSNRDLIYESSNPAIASVDGEGLVTGVSVGRATILVTSSAKKSLTASVSVNVVEQDAPRLAGVVVGIDPGHQVKLISRKYPISPRSSQTAYGCKPGATGDYTGIPEYVTNREISQKLRALLEEAGATVIMTRTTDDVFLTNIERAQMLNDENVDISLHVHCNSDKNHKSEGLSCFIRTTGDHVDESREFAAMLSDEMSRATGAKNLGVKTSNTYMSLNWTTTPSVLLEMGYISNQKEDTLLNNDDYQNRMAKGIFEGLCRYFDR